MLLGVPLVFGMADNNIIDIKAWVVTAVFFMPKPFQITAAEKGKADAKHH